MRRVSVVGSSGSGKSTLAGELAARLGLPHIELDGIFHQRDWIPLPEAEFMERVSEATKQDGWVIDGNYSTVRGLVWSRADTVVWLDLPRRTVMRRLGWRTLRRVVLRTELWNGNREPLRNLFSRDPEQSVIAWSWYKHAELRRRYTAATLDPANAHLEFIRVAGPNDARLALAAAGPAPKVRKG
jgi:adenylate kinase family enzyme